MNNLLRFFVPFFISLLIASACYAQKPIVFASIPPQKWILDQIAGDLVDTHTLVDNGQDPHTYEPTPKQIVSLSAARLFFTLDMTFEKIIVDKLLKNSSTLEAIDCTQGITKIPFLIDDHEEENADEHHEDEHDGHHHDENELDPHVWLSPLNLKIIADHITKGLIGIDKQNTEIYTARSNQLQQRLDKLHHAITKQLQPYSGARFYVFHPSFGYFAFAYNLHQEAVEVEGKSPSPRQISNIIGQARTENVKVIFTQPQFDQRSAKTIASAIQGQVVPLDPLAEDVEQNIQDMANKISKALIAN